MIENIQAEQAVIGALLLEGSLFENTQLESEHFYDRNLKRIFQSISDVSKKEQAIDIVTVSTELGSELEAIGNVSFLTELAGSVATTENIRFYETSIFEAYRNRKTRSIALKYAENPNDQELSGLVKDLESLQELGIQQEEKTTYDYLAEIAEDMSKPPEDTKRGFPTGYTDFDRMTGGTQPGDLIIIAARPSVGKTAFALNISRGHCANGGSTTIFSLEMGVKQLLQRVISAEGHVDSQKWRSMEFATNDYDKAIAAIGNISTWDLDINEKAKTVNDMKANIRKKVHDQPDQKHLFIIDYLQLMSSTGRYERRDLEVGAMTRELKLLAKDLDVPIVLLSQLSRGVEQRQDKRPMMSDLRESGNIEQDADVVGFLYRDDYYDKESDKQNIIEIILSKQRNGPTGTVELAFLKEYGKFVSLDHRYSNREG
jgi:replicative DNA helicase